MRSKEQIDAAAGAYYRANEAKNRNISSAALKSFKDGIKWADNNPENPWHPVSDPPKEPGFVLLWAKAEEGPESPFVARYCGDGYFDLGYPVCNCPYESRSNASCFPNRIVVGMAL